MAFQAPTRAHRQLSVSQQEPPHTNCNSSVAQPLLTPETEEWIVFSPSAVGDTNTVLSGTNQLSRESDIASIITASSLRFSCPAVIPGTFDEHTEVDEEDDESSLDGAETDSLQPFRDHQGPVMLPTHDGLGTFQSSSDATGFRSLEESLRIVAASEGSEQNDIHSRIHKWRLEQGHALMDEIERATRRRRRASLMSRRSGLTGMDSKLDETASMGDLSGIGAEQPRTPLAPTLSRVHSESGETSDETFWKRITRSFIRDIIGIDDHLLEVIFGESLPAEARTDSPVEEIKLKKDVGERILSRIAKELGELVHLYTHHSSGTGAFSAKLEDRGGEDNDGECKTPQPCFNQHQPGPAASPRTLQRSASFVSLASGESSVPQFQFAPTLALRQEEASHAALWGIEEETKDLARAQLRQEYWEQELDVRLVFSFLKSRFTGFPRSPTTTSPTTNQMTPLHHHHPLINRKQNPIYWRTPTTQSKILSSTTSGLGYFGSPMGGKIGSSCASYDRVVKERRSSKASSRSRGHYWDVATSVGSGQTGSCVGTGMWAAI